MACAWQVHGAWCAYLRLRLDIIAEPHASGRTDVHRVARWADEDHIRGIELVEELVNLRLVL